MRTSRAAVLTIALLLASGLALRGDVNDQARYQRLGAQLICTCGCTQSALTCNHVGCTVVTQMQAEIHQRAASADSDDLVLQSFVQEYGTQVLANPTHKGFNQIAWIMPWVALGLGLAVLFFYFKRWRHDEPVAAAAANGPNPALQAEIQAVLDEDLKP